VPVLLIYFAKIRLPVVRTLDLCASVVPLGHAFGRFGCFMNGCCFGHVSEMPWALHFPRIEDEAGRIVGSPPFSWQYLEGMIGTEAHHSLPVHPTQLYAVGYNLLLFALLSVLLYRHVKPGIVGGSYLVLYGISRFTNEHFRADTEALALGMSVAQFIAILAVVGGLVYLLRSTLAPRPEPEAAPEPEVPTDKPAKPPSKRRSRRKR
jgi:phosphatidylglycerol:prolipoprotein diacylglycerol transferase